MRGKSKGNEEERRRGRGQLLKSGFGRDGSAGSLLFPLGHQTEITRIKHRGRSTQIISAYIPLL